jgi:peptidoglycan/LPS O-acetylase OafA/YrhL
MYLFHGLIFHTFVLIGLRGSWGYFWGSLVLTIVMESLSWKFVEAPALKRKKWSLKRS